MRILLDENMLIRLLAALLVEDHGVDSVKSLQLQGIDNGALYQFAASNYVFALRAMQSFQDECRRNPPRA